MIDFLRRDCCHGHDFGESRETWNRDVAVGYAPAPATGITDPVLELTPTMVRECQFDDCYETDVFTGQNYYVPMACLCDHGDRERLRVLSELAELYDRLNAGEGDLNEFRLRLVDLMAEERSEGQAE